MSTRMLNFSRGDAMLSVARRTAGLICSQAYWKVASRRPCLSVKCLMSCDWLVPASLQMAAVVAASKPRSAMRSLADSRRRSLLEEITEVFRSEEHTSELQSRLHLVCRLLLEKKKKHT